MDAGHSNERKEAPVRKGGLSSTYVHDENKYSDVYVELKERQP